MKLKHFWNLNIFETWTFLKLKHFWNSNFLNLNFLNFNIFFLNLKIYIYIFLIPTCVFVWYYMKHVWVNITFLNLALNWKIFLAFVYLISLFFSGCCVTTGHHNIKRDIYAFQQFSNGHSDQAEVVRCILLSLPHI